MKIRNAWKSKRFQIKCDVWYASLERFQAFSILLWTQNQWYPQRFLLSFIQRYRRLPRGFNKFLHKWVLKSNRQVYLPKARRAFDPVRVRGHAPPENFEVLDFRRCIFVYFQVFFCCFVSFFAPKSTNLNKFEENYVTMKYSQSTISIQVLLFNTFTTGIFKMV